MIFNKLFGKQAGPGDWAALMQKGDFAGAAAALAAELEKKPGDVNLLVKKAECHERLGQVDAAVADLDAAVKVHTEEGFLAKAVALQKKIAKLKPEAAHHTSELIAAEVQENRGEKEWQMKAVPSLFADFSREELKEVIEGMEVRTYAPADLLCREGEPGASLMCITEGTVEVSTKAPDGQEVPLKELGPGDFFGEVAFLTGKARTATVTALEPVEALELTKERMLEVVARYPHVEKVMEEYRQRRAQHTVETLVQRIKEGKKA
jgi:CRP-like cAMP-binding protein